MQVSFSLAFAILKIKKVRYKLVFCFIFARFSRFLK